MNYKISSFLFILYTAINLQNIDAQSLNISGDTIFVNTWAEIQLVFPAQPKSFHTVPDNTQYRIWNAGTGINLIAGSENYNPVTLLVSEAERSHRFTLIYKNDSNNNPLKLYYDYSTIKKLAQHTRQTSPSGSDGSAKTIVKTEPVKHDNNQSNKEITAAVPVDSSSDYNALLQQGDKDLQLQNYQDAISDFNKAHILRPNDAVPSQKLEEIKIKLAEQDKSAEQEIDKNYLALTAGAKTNMDQKKYTEATEAYNQALALKPGDVYSTQQLQTISNLVAQQNAKREKEKIDSLNKENSEKAANTLRDKQLSVENNYDTAIKSADNLFTGGDYENAKTAYYKALTFIKRDWPGEQINKINKILYEQNIQAEADKKKLAQQPEITAEIKTKTDNDASPAEIRKKYNLAIANGRSSYFKKDLLNAKLFYEEAMNLQPSQQGPKNQLKIINKKLEDSARETDLNNNYERTIALADSQVNTKAFEAAVMSYKQASLLKPLESYPWKQLKYMQSELAGVEKRKREEKEQQYIDALTRADKAVTDKKYDDAKSAYKEALAIHSDNEYAQRRLEIISYQIEVEKARIEKLSQDTVKEEVPVKKIKRRKF